MEALRKNMSLAVTKIGFPRNNYIDKLAPLTIPLYGIDKVATLVLLE